jgi:hypothetical protein
MKHHDRIARGAHLLAALALAAGLAACGERISDTRVKAPEPQKPESSAVVVGQVPADPTGDPPGTTPVVPNTSDVSPRVESRGKPEEGDSNSYSTTAPVTPQKAEGVSIPDARSKQ